MNVVEIPTGLPSIRIQESRFVPEGTIWSLDRDPWGKPKMLLVWDGGTGELVRRLGWVERCPVMEMTPDQWAGYAADPRPLTPGEWLADCAQRATDAAIRETDAILERWMAPLRRAFAGER